MTNKDYMRMQIEKMHAEAVAEIARQIYIGNFSAEYADKELHREDQRYLKAISIINNDISDAHKTVQKFEES